jgi:hypothetical protein
MEWYELCGVLSAVISISAYAAVQWRRDFAKTILFSVSNLVNAALMLVSLAYAWNIGSFLTNIFWLFISMFGIYRCLQYKRRSGAPYVAKTRRLIIRRQPKPELRKTA